MKLLVPQAVALAWSAVLLADAAVDPLGALLNTGGMAAIAGILLLLHRDALKTFREQLDKYLTAFREELKAERDAAREEGAAGRTAGREAWEKLTAMSDRQHGENAARIESLRQEIAEFRHRRPTDVVRRPDVAQRGGS